MSIIKKRFSFFKQNVSGKVTKIPGRKRKIFATIALAFSLMFGKTRLNSSQSSSPNWGNQEVQQRFINNQEFNLVEEKYDQVILAKGGGPLIVPPTNPVPSNFPTPPSGARPSRPPHVNPFRVPPKLVPGLGAGGNPAGAGNGGNAPEFYEFNDQCPAPKNEETNYDSRSSGQEKKKKVIKVEDSIVEVSSDEKNNPIVTIKRKDGGTIVCTYEQALNKYYHADAQGLQFPEGFDKNYATSLKPADRQAYIASTVPREKILEFLKANVRSLSSESLKPVPGFIGARKDPGTIYFNKNTREIHFVNEGTNEWRTTVIQSERQFAKLVENGFHLFPQAGG